MPKTGRNCQYGLSRRSLDWYLSRFPPRLSVGGLLRLTLLLSVTAVVGCGASAQPVFEVRGKVTYRQEAVPTGSVTFAPKGGGELVVTAITADGDYQLKAPAGTYEVAVAAIGEVAQGRAGFEQKTSRPLVPAKFSYPSRSGIVVSVEEIEVNEIDIALE